MKIKLNNKYIKWGLTLFLVVAASIVFYYLLFHGTNIKQGFDKVMGILMPILFGLAMAYLMTPVLNFFENRIRKSGSPLSGLSAFSLRLFWCLLLYIL